MAVSRLDIKSTFHIEKTGCNLLFDCAIIIFSSVKPSKNDSTILSGKNGESTGKTISHSQLFFFVHKRPLKIPISGPKLPA